MRISIVRYFIPVALIGVLLLLALAKFSSSVTVPVAVVRFAVPTQISGGAVFVGVDRDLFKPHGIELHTTSFRLGKQALEAVLAGQADLALVADTPFVLSALSGKKIAIVAQAYSSRSAMALLVRTDRGIYSVDDLRGKRIGTIKGTNAEYFLDTLLTAHRMTTADITLVSPSPDQLPVTMGNGALDAATLWFPDLGNVQGSLGPMVKTFQAKDVFVYRMLIVARAEYVERHVAELARVLAALDQATSYIHQHPDLARGVIARSIGIESHALMPAFEPGDFQIGMDQSLLLALSHQTRWAVSKGLAAPASAPDYSVLLQPAALRTVLPHAVRVVY